MKMVAEERETGKAEEAEEGKVDVLKKYRLAGKILAEVLEEAVERVKVGVPLLDVASFVENKTREKGAEPAFPCNISVNEEASHATPSADDTTAFKDGDIVKLDIGVHIDGYIADAAITVDLSSDGRHEALVRAAEDALNAAIAVVKAGVRTTEISEVIERTIRERGFKPIVNLTGHGLARFNPHAPPSIPNVKQRSGEILRAGDVIAIEPFATDGAGKVVEGSRTEIYKLVRLKPVRLPAARRLLAEIIKFRGLPFAKRWLAHPSEIALRTLEREGILRAFPVLREESHGLVSQAEHTLLVKNDGCEVLTSRSREEGSPV